MGFWFFLTVVVVGNMALKAYKLRVHAHRSEPDSGRLSRLELELARLKDLAEHNHNKRLEQLEESVFFGDFELKRQFTKLETELGKKS